MLFASAAAASFDPKSLRLAKESVDDDTINRQQAEGNEPSQ
jgi:hypothetical protein